MAIVFFIVENISAIAIISFEIMSSADIVGLGIVCTGIGCVCAKGTVEDCDMVGGTRSIEGEEGEVGGVVEGERGNFGSRAPD